MPICLETRSKICCIFETHSHCALVLSLIPGFEVDGLLTEYEDHPMPAVSRHRFHIRIGRNLQNLQSLENLQEFAKFTTFTNSTKSVAEL